MHVTYSMSVHSREKNHYSVVLPEGSYFELSMVLQVFYSPVSGSKGKGQHICTVYKSPLQLPGSNSFTK